MKFIYPICPECLKNTVVLFSPPNLPADEWSLYCSNGESNCGFRTKLNDLITPKKEETSSCRGRVIEEILGLFAEHTLKGPDMLSLEARVRSLKGAPNEGGKE